MLKSIDLIKFAGGTGVPTLNRNVVHEHKVLVADKTTQSIIANKIDDSMNSGKILLEKYQAKLKKLADLRQSLLAEALVN